MNQNTYFETIKSYKLLANKSLGQNFLINEEVCLKIIKLLDIGNADNVLEIGCGLGSLTYFLNEENCKKTTIDVDERMLSFVKENLHLNNLQIKRTNALKEDYSTYTKIVGNLPYYITTGIIETVLLRAKNAKKIVFMVQKEVASKLISSNQEVSPLTLLINYVSNAKINFNVGKNSFTPIPHVDSAVFELVPNEKIKNTENEELYTLIKKIFLLRRKTVLNNLTNVLGNKDKAATLLDELNTDYNKRPEQLNIEFYLNLLNKLKENKK